MTCKKFDQMLTKMVINPHKKLRDFLNEHSETISYISRHAGKVSLYKRNKMPKY